MITFNQLSKIFREHLKMLFPDKHVSSNESKSRNMEVYEMQFHIVVDPEKPDLIIGFTREAGSSMINIWTGKRVCKVIDICVDNGIIRMYHEPKLYAESSKCLRYTQVYVIYIALKTFLNYEYATEDDIEQFSEEYIEYLNLLTKKKHPLHNSPTFSEEERVEEKQWVKPGGIKMDYNKYMRPRTVYEFKPDNFVIGGLYAIVYKNICGDVIRDKGILMRVEPNKISFRTFCADQVEPFQFSVLGIDSTDADRYEIIELVENPISFDEYEYNIIHDALEARENISNLATDKKVFCRIRDKVKKLTIFPKEEEK